MTYDEAFSFSMDNIANYDEEALISFRQLISEVENLEIGSGEDVHNEMHENYGLLPDAILNIVKEIDNYFPKQHYSKLDIELISKPKGINRKKLRIRLVGAIILSKIIEAKLNG